MKTRPIVPYTVSEQIEALERMAPELAEMGSHRSLYTMAKHLQQVAEEEGFNLRIVEVDSTPTPNPLAPVLAQERIAHRSLRLNIARGLTFTFIPLAVCCYGAATHGDWLSAVVNGFLAAISVRLIRKFQAARMEKVA